MSGARNGDLPDACVGLYCQVFLEWQELSASSAEDVGIQTGLENRKGFIDSRYGTVPDELCGLYSHDVH